MKRIFAFAIILIALTSCTAPQTQAGLPNPASVFYEQNGNKLEIRTAPDGSACDEWAYYRGECGPAAVEATTDVSGGGTGGDNPGSSMPPGATEEVADWWGFIKSTEPGAQFDDYFERQDLGQIISFDIDSMDPAIESQIEALQYRLKLMMG
jgi:putative hemolysin